MPDKEIVERLSRRSSSDDGMIQAPAREPQARANIFEFEIWHLLNDLLGREAVSQKIQDVAYPDTHAADTGPSSTLLRVNRNAIRHLSHNTIFRLILFSSLSLVSYTPLPLFRRHTQIVYHSPARKLTLEDALEYIGDDELVELTPASIRRRKKILEPGMGK
jgi:hypothetical protein